MRYPEFQNDSDDEDEDDEDEDEDEDDEDNDIKLPKLITKEAVIAILKPDVVSYILTTFHLLPRSFLVVWIWI